MAATTTILAKDELLAGYRVEDIIGFGGMAIVYRAEQISLGRRVALKILAPQLSNDEAFRERFRREGKHIASLDHPNVVAVYDSGEIDGRLYLAMRLVEGETLAARMQVGVSAQQTLALLRPIADALDAAHALGLVHRDVKPQNILISSTDRPYLADFGVAKVGAATLGLTAAGGFVGSINYASPEQIRGEQTTPVGDVYSLTAVLYQCLTGQVPYPRDTELTVMQAHLNDPPPTLAAFAPSVPALDLVIARGMAKDAAARYASASDLISAAAAALTRLSHSQRRAVPAFAAVEQATVDYEPTVDDVTTVVSRDAAPATVDQAPPVNDRTEPVTRDATPAPSPAAPAPTPSREPSAMSAYTGDTEIVPADERRARRPTANTTTADRRRSAPITKPETPARDGRRRAVIAGWGLLGIVVLAVVAVVAVVAVLAAGGAGGSTAARSTIARSGPLAIAYASPWRTVAVGTAASVFPAGQAVGDAQSFGTNPPIRLTSGRVTLAAGLLKDSAEIPGGAPPQLLVRYGTPKTATNSTVAGAAGRAYTWMASGEPVVAYVIPTTQADVAIVCQAAAAELPACTELATHAKLSGMQRVAPGADQAVGQALNQRLARVRSRRDGLDGLGASKLTDRAPKAQSLSDAEAHAAASIAAIAVPARYRAAVDRLSAALKGEASAFAALAADARASHRAAYEGAVRGVNAASARLRAASTALSGYRLGVPTFAVLRLDPAPLAPSAPKSTPLSVGGHIPAQTQTPARTQTPAQTRIPAQTHTQTQSHRPSTIVTPFS